MRESRRQDKKDVSNGLDHAGHDATVKKPPPKALLDGGQATDKEDNGDDGTEEEASNAVLTDLAPNSNSNSTGYVSLAPTLTSKAKVEIKVNPKKDLVSK